MMVVLMKNIKINMNLNMNTLVMVSIMILEVLFFMDKFGVEVPKEVIKTDLVVDAVEIVDDKISKELSIDESLLLSKYIIQRVEELLVPYIVDGELVRKLPTIQEIREYINRCPKLYLGHRFSYFFCSAQLPLKRCPSQRKRSALFWQIRSHQ